MDTPTERELILARGLLALLRTHESAGDPHTWAVDSAPWGDGRTTYEVHESTLRSSPQHGPALRLVID